MTTPQANNTDIFLFRANPSGNPQGFKDLITGHHRYAALHPEDPDVKSWQAQDSGTLAALCSEISRGDKQDAPAREQAQQLRLRWDNLHEQLSALRVEMVAFIARCR